MSDFDLQIKQGTITVNLDNLKAELKEISDKYKGIVIKEDEVALAKKDLARLRKIRKSVDDRRKEVKAEWERPFKDFEQEVKDALSIIDAPISEIDGIIKDYESQSKAEKEQHCRDLFNEAVGDCKEYLEFADVFKETWLNKSTTDNEILSDISGERVKIHSDMTAIKALQSEFEDEVIKAYKSSGNNLASAIQRNQQLISAKQIAEKKVEQEVKEEPKEEFKEEPKNPYGIFTVRPKDEEQTKQLKQFLEFSEIQFSVVY